MKCQLLILMNYNPNFCLRPTVKVKLVNVSNTMSYIRGWFLDIFVLNFYFSSSFGCVTMTSVIITVTSPIETEFFSWKHLTGRNRSRRSKCDRRSELLCCQVVRYPMHEAFTYGIRPYVFFYFCRSLWVFNFLIFFYYKGAHNSIRKRILTGVPQWEIIFYGLKWLF